MLGPKPDITEIHTNWMLEVDGLGSHSPPRPSPAQNGSDEATAAHVTKQVPESHWLLNARQTIGRHLGQSPNNGAEGGGRVCDQAAGGGREGKWVGSRHGEGLALSVRKRKVSWLGHLGGRGSIP